MATSGAMRNRNGTTSHLLWALSLNRYFEQEDILHLVISEESESRSLELSPDITVELNEQNELIGVEILNASKFLRDAVLESIQAKTLQILEAQAA